MKDVNNYLNVAAICPLTKTLGPGRRFVVWLQGCFNNCPGCGSPEWKPIKKSLIISPENLASEIIRTPNIEGITLSGGEPMLQAENLVMMLNTVFEKRRLTVICYTGYYIEELKRQDNHHIATLLNIIDVLIDGPYFESLNDNKGWRGSSNQRIHFLTGIYKDAENEFINRRRDIEIHLLKDCYLEVGIKPKALKAVLNRI